MGAWMPYIAIAGLLGAALITFVLGSLATPDDRRRVQEWAHQGRQRVLAQLGALPLPPQLLQVIPTRRPEPADATPAPGSTTTAPTAPSALGRPTPAPLAWYHPDPTRAPARVGDAADQPPPGIAPLLETLAWIDRQQGADPYRFPIGWRQLADGSLRLETATYSQGRIDGATRHGATSGQTAAGKGGYAMQKILSMLARTSPEQYQVCILDGKRLDFYAYRSLAHVWGLANTIAEFPGLLARIDAERERRQRLLNRAGKKNWHAYQALPQAEHETLPLLHIYVAELALLEGAMGKDIWTWLNDHLTTARAFGFVFDVDLQSASNTPTLWRRQLQLFLGGYQPSPDDDRPNTTLVAEQIRARGMVPPSELPGEPGYFCVVHGRRVFNVRTSLISDADEAALLARLPSRAGPTPEGEVAPDPDAVARSAAIARRLMTVERVTRDAALTLMGLSEAERVAVKEYLDHESCEPRPEGVRTPEPPAG